MVRISSGGSGSKSTFYSPSPPESCRWLRWWFSLFACRPNNVKRPSKVQPQQEKRKEGIATRRGLICPSSRDFFGFFWLPIANRVKLVRSHTDDTSVFSILSQLPNLIMDDLLWISRLPVAKVFEQMLKEQQQMAQKNADWNMPMPEAHQRRQEAWWAQQQFMAIWIALLLERSKPNFFTNRAHIQVAHTYKHLLANKVGLW